MHFSAPSPHEIHGRAVEPLAIGVGRDDIGPHFAQGLQRTIVDRGVDFHTARVDHGHQEGVVGHFIVVKERPDGDKFERRHGNKGHIAGIGHALGRGKADAQAGVAARTARHRNGIEGNGVALGKAQGSSTKGAGGGMRGASRVVFEITCEFFRHSDGTNGGGGFYVENARHGRGIFSTSEALPVGTGRAERVLYKLRI